ncbi:MAG: hypothetical protein GY807_07655 [Gammaproteobacteria bacterium]|nr:hypothetical protein [Gammaproteobacteria bacterium]
MEIVYFTLVAMLLYLVSDRLLRGAEKIAGRSFEHRSLIFFFLLLVLAMSSFSLIQHLTA